MTMGQVGGLLSPQWFWVELDCHEYRKLNLYESSHQHWYCDCDCHIYACFSFGLGLCVWIRMLDQISYME